MMLEIKFPIKVTKELIESKVSQETLMSTYYGVPIKKGLFKAKNRVDHKPTVAYYKNSKGRIIVKDFGSDYTGDWIFVVKEKYQCSYQKALNIAANDFGIQSFPKLQKNKIIESDEILDNKQGAIIQVEIKDFTEFDIQWWAKYGIQLSTLKKFKVFSCKNVFLNGNLFEMVLDKQLVFGYYGGIKQDIEQWRIYHPQKTKYKWISNWKNHQIQGAHMLPKQGGDLLVITKSLKDVMCLYEYGIISIAPCSENEFLTDTQYQKVKSKFKHIALLWDNDYAGVSNAWKIRKAHPDIKVMFIPKSSGCKDFSDYRKTYGDKKTQELIKQAKEFYKL